MAGPAGVGNQQSCRRPAKVQSIPDAALQSSTGSELHLSHCGRLPAHVPAVWRCAATSERSAFPLATAICPSSLFASFTPAPMIYDTVAALDARRSTSQSFAQLLRVSCRLYHRPIELKFTSSTAHSKGYRTVPNRTFRAFRTFSLCRLCLGVGDGGSGSVAVSQMVW